VRLTDQVRESARAIASAAQFVRIDLDALGSVDPGDPPALDAETHFLEGEPADVATYLLCLDTVNFGSGWWPTIRKRRGMSGYFTMAAGLTERFRADGAWTPAELRAMRTEEVADVLGQRRDHELMALYAQALRELGRWLGARSALEGVEQAGGSAERLAELLAGGMAMYADRGFYKRAQIVPADLALAGVARFDDLHRLTVFADNLVPHVLRCDGVLVYDERLAAHIDAARPLRFGGRQEREIRGCAIHACELLAERLGLSAHELDHRLWTRGQAPAYKARPRHRARTVFY
jgi:hypothetical protein